MNGPRIILTLNPIEIGNVLFNTNDNSKSQNNWNIDEILEQIKEDQYMERVNAYQNPGFISSVFDNIGS